MRLPLSGRRCLHRREEVFEPAEHSLDQIAVLVSLFIVFDRLPASLPTRDAGFNASAFKRGAEPVGVIPAIRDEEVGVRQRGQDGRRPLVIADLPLGEQQY